MLPTFSVKKPFTVLVCVVLVLVLGVVAVTRMTPDLLPELELPYIILFTAYTGASPEEVEQTVTKPIEQQMAELSNIKNITSTSAENYSIVMLEFNDSVNMDAITVDIREGLDQISGSWDSFVGTTSILKLSPDIIPTTVAAVNYTGKDQVELSAFLQDTLAVELEGIDGVAAVTKTGLVVEQLRVTVDSDKLDALNEKLFAAVEDEFSDALSQLADSRQELADGQQAVKDGWAELDEKQAALKSGRAQAASGLRQAETQLTEKETQLLDTQTRLRAQRTQLAEQLDALLVSQQKITELSGKLSVLHTSEAAFAAALAQIDANTQLNETEKAEQKQAITGSAEYQAVQDGLAAAAQALAALNLTEGELSGKLAEMDTAKSGLETAIAGVDATLTTVADGLAQVADGFTELSSRRGQVNAQLAAAENALAEAEDTLNTTEEQLADGETQLEAAEDQANEKLDAALSAVNLHTVLSKETVAALLSAQNFAMPAGYVSCDGDSYLVNVGEKLYGEDSLNAVPLLHLDLGDVGTVYLSDVATIEKSDNSGENFAKINGEDAVLLSFSKQSTYATATVADNIGDRFTELSEKYPGLTFVKLMDQGDYIDLAINSVVENLLLGAVLAILILLLFLRDIRPTFIVACSIPISVLFALALMYFSGVTMNLLSMAGLAIGIGMLVDNSIVVIENTYRLRAMGVSAKKAAIEGAKQVTAAITASTLTTVCVFLPIVFVQGLTRQLFTDMALTITYSLLASLIVAVTLIPALSGWVLKKPVRPAGKVTTRLTGAVEKGVRFALGHRALCILVAVALLAASAAFALLRGFAYFPESGGSQVSVTLDMGADATFEEKTALTEEAMDRISALDGVTDVGGMLSNGIASVVGIDTSAAGSASESATIYVLLNDRASRRSMSVRSEIADTLTDLSDRCDVTVSGVSTMDYSSVLGGSGVVVNLYGSDLTDMRDTAAAIAAALQDVEGVQQVDDGLGDVSPALHISIDRDKAILSGLTVAQAYQQIAARLSASTTAMQLETGSTSLDVIVISGEDAAFNLEDLKAVTLKGTGADGSETSVPLSDIATFTETVSPQSIARENQRRVITVSAAVADGYNVTHVSSAARTALDSVAIPAGCTLVYEGENESIQSALGDLLFMLLLGIAIIYLIMVAQFQSLLSPFIVMFTIPLAFTGGFIALLIAGMEVSIVSMVGMIMLVGVVVNNGIVLIDCINRLRAEGMAARDAIVEAVRMRLRPVLMTALTTILGLLPLALGVGSGVEMVQPVAVVCIGGLTYATLTTLFIIPVLYDVFAGRHAPRAEDDPSALPEGTKELGAADAADAPQSAE